MTPSPLANDGSDEPSPSVAAMVVAGGIVAAATAAFGPAGAVAGAMLTPMAEELVSRAAAEWRSEGQRRAGLALGEAAADGNATVEEVLERSVADSTRLGLLAQTIESAAQSSLDAKVRMLGSALSSGVLAADDARVDEAQLKIGIIRELEAPHLKVLQAIDAESRHTQGRWKGVSERTLVDTVGDGGGMRSTGVLQPILRTLDRNGLISRVAIGAIWDEHPADDFRPDAGSNEWATTIFGRELLSEFLAKGWQEETKPLAAD